LSSDNPFLTPGDVPYGAPPFDRILDDHFLPAIEEGMRAHLGEVAAITSQAEPATFANTIEQLERSGDLLSRVLRVFFGKTGTYTNDRVQEIQAEVAPKLAAHNDAIVLDSRLYERIERVYSSRSGASLTPEQRHLVERYHLDFVRAGARLGEKDKETLRALNQEESTLTTEFQSRLLAANKAGAIVVDEIGQLVGMSEGDVAAAAQAAQERGLPGKFVLSLQNTTQQESLESLVLRDVRDRVYQSAIHRADRGDEHDTRELIRRLAQIRAERSALLGFPTTAAYVLDDQMAKTPEAAIGLLRDIAGTAVKKARDEASRMQTIADESGGGFRIAPWDWQFYAERVRRAEYELDEARIRPYFELNRVVHDGVFFAAGQLYGLTFVERHDIPKYHPDVRVYEVFDDDDTPVALFYTDFFRRDNKSGGAWMDSFVDQSRLLARKPVIYNVTNFVKPAAGLPALLSFDDVITLFHEFGHALHGMLSNVTYPTLTGTNVPRDFVEFPSQFNEHWALEPSVFANYARHHETGEPMPQELVDRIKKSRTFNQGFALTEYISAAMLDMAWHTLPAGAPLADVAAIEAEALARFREEIPEVPPRYYSTYFSHIWDGGYNAGYYAYLWAEVLDHDAYAWFKERGGMTRENGQLFREKILSRGGTADAAELYREFRGRDPIVDPLLAARGLKPEAGT
jgi:peptidyl-dipeptidase Dcp